MRLESIEIAIRVSEGVSCFVQGFRLCFFFFGGEGGGVVISS